MSDNWKDKVGWNLLQYTLTIEIFSGEKPNFSSNCIAYFKPTPWKAE